MLFVGIDLAAEARRTGVAVVREDGALSLEQVRVGGSDEDLVAAVEAADRTGVDVPLGWPAGGPDLKLVCENAESMSRVTVLGWSSRCIRRPHCTAGP